MGFQAVLNSFSNEEFDHALEIALSTGTVLH